MKNIALSYLFYNRIKISFLLFFLACPIVVVANESADKAVRVGVAVYKSEICQEYKDIEPMSEYWSVVEGFSRHQEPDVAVDALIRQAGNPLAECSFHLGWAVGAFMSAMQD